MDVSLIILAIPIYFLLIGVELLVSWWRDRKAYRLGDAISNIGCGIVEQTSGVFLKVFVIGLYALVYQKFRITTIEMTPWMILAMFISVDFLYYWAHRMSHEINLFWIGHVVHHQSEDYNLSVALRQGALQKIFTAPFFLPLAIFGFSDTWFLAISAINTLYQFWIHTEFIGKLGWLEYVFNTPSHHRVHHATNAQYIDKNHGGSLIIWDRLFGTFAEEQEQPIYGITTPVNTFNPVRAHWLPIRNLYHDFQQAQGWEKWHMLWRSPAWLAEKRPASYKSEKRAQKFDFLLRAHTGRYLLVQFVIALGLVAMFLFSLVQLPVWQKVTGALMIFLLMGLLGSMAEARWQKPLVEWLRLALIPFMMALVGQSLWFVVVGLTAALFSGGWYMRLRFTGRL
jgi:alkylglycerol monooxygenase